MSGLCRVGASMSEDYDNHALHCPECSAVEAARAERLAAAVDLLRRITDDMSAWDERMECQCCGNRYRQGHEKDCTWLAAHAFVESESQGRG